MVFTTDFTMLTERAIAVAVRAFQGRREKGGTPVINHSLRVGMAGENETQRVLGYLHDVIEDTNIRAEDLLEWGFPEYIVSGLKLLTHFSSLISYNEYIDRIEKKGNKDVLTVKLNDLIDNLKRDDAKTHPERVLKHLNAYYQLLGVYEKSYGTFLGKIKKGYIQGQQGEQA